MRLSSEQGGDPAGDQTLDQLRQEIEEVDQQFATLLSQRQKLAQRILQRKVELKQPLRNFSVEQQVIDRFATLCRDQGIEARWGVDLANFLISKSLETQSNILEQRRPGDRLRVLVVGGLGKMGRWMSGFLHNQGHKVQIFDPDPHHSPFPRAATIEEGITASQMVIVSVPLNNTPRVLSEVLALKPTGVVFDICSLKKDVLPILRCAADEGLLVTSLHPLFGSDITTLYGRNIVLCPCGQPTADQLAASLFTETAAKLITLPPEQHDHLMSLTLGISHTLNLVFARVLAASGENFESLLTVASSTFTKQIRTTLEVVADNMELYFDIQRQSDYAEIFSALSRELDCLHRMVESNERPAFQQAMAEVVDYFNQLTGSIHLAETE